jgi:FKBP-type peptidyl-prolyl cis-trans isomerase (trigger factor)
MEDLRKEWRVDAEKRAKLQVILSEIAKKESIEPDAARLDREVAHLLEHYPDAEEPAIRSYVTAQMLNELVFALLEGREPVFEEHDHDHE